MTLRERFEKETWNNFPVNMHKPTTELMIKYADWLESLNTELTEEVERLRLKTISAEDVIKAIKHLNASEAVNDAVRQFQGYCDKNLADTWEMYAEEKEKRRALQSKHDELKQRVEACDNCREG